MVPSIDEAELCARWWRFHNDATSLRTKIIHLTDDILLMIVECLSEDSRSQPCNMMAPRTMAPFRDEWAQCPPGHDHLPPTP